MWNGGQEMTQSGIKFSANIPTEEIFTLPHKDQVEGIVSGTKPIYYGGSLIEDFTLTFSEGRVVRATARKGEDSLHRLLETDEGANRLGEVALVPHSSPISRSGRLFYNIVLDENASSHLAFGWAYKVMMQGGGQMSAEAFSAAGGNLSQAHVDFMIGSGEMDVDGIRKDGLTEAVMRSGEWAFNI
jgi:aminopeptidase